MTTRERIGMAAGLILILLVLACMVRTVNTEIARRWVFKQSFHGAMFQDCDSGSIEGEK